MKYRHPTSKVFYPEHIKHLLFFALITLVSSCSFKMNRIQHIAIDHYPSSEENMTLAKGLLAYDLKYLAHKVPSFNEATSKGIMLGYFINSSNKKISYRITYDLSNDSVSDNIETLEAEFDKFIKELIETHTSNEDLFKKLTPIGGLWGKGIFTRSADVLYDESSSILKSIVSKKEFVSHLKKVKTEFGAINRLTIINAQYNEQYNEIPESVVLQYAALQSEKSKGVISLRLHNDNNIWSVIGFNARPNPSLVDVMKASL